MENHEDILNAVLTDVVADQVRRALQLGYQPHEVMQALKRGTEHGITEWKEIQRGGR